MCRKRLSSPRCRFELIESAWVVIVPGQKCMKKKVLTPSHLFMGRRLISHEGRLLMEIYDESSETLNNRQKYLKTLLQHYENRWKKEYLTELREFQKLNNRVPEKQIKVGDVVLIEEEGLPRSRWRLGKVHELITSKDGYVRACKLLVYNENRKNSFINRPVNKLCYFMVSSNDKESK